MNKLHCGDSTQPLKVTLNYTIRSILNYKLISLQAGQLGLEWFATEVNRWRQTIVRRWVNWRLFQEPRHKSSLDILSGSNKLFTSYTFSQQIWCKCSSKPRCQCFQPLAYVFISRHCQKCQRAGRQSGIASSQIHNSPLPDNDLSPFRPLMLLSSPQKCLSSISHKNKKNEKDTFTGFIWLPNTLRTLFFNYLSQIVVQIDLCLRPLMIRSLR